MRESKENREAGDMSKRDAEIIERLKREGRVTYADAAKLPVGPMAREAMTGHSITSNSSIVKIIPKDPRQRMKTKPSTAGRGRQSADTFAEYARTISANVLANAGCIMADAAKKRTGRKRRGQRAR